MIEDTLRNELRASFKNRAILYYLIFDELRNEVGEQKAAEILKRAIYRRGEQIGQQGRVWAVLKNDELHGMIFFHGGDSSDFVAKKKGQAPPKSKKGRR